MPSEQDKLLKYFLDLLSKRDYSQKELVNKAFVKNYDPELIQKSLSFLESQNYVDDFRLAQNLVEYYGQNKGKKWLLQKLQTRLIPTNIIQETLNAYVEQIPNNLKRKVEIKYKITNWQAIEPSTEHKIVGFLARQGFDSPYQILQSWQI